MPRSINANPKLSKSSPHGWLLLATGIGLYSNPDPRLLALVLVQIAWVMVSVPSVRLVWVVIIALAPYAVGVWVGYLFGVVYQPVLSGPEYLALASYQLGTCSTFGALLLVSGLAQKWNSALRRAMQPLNGPFRLGRFRQLTLGTLVVVGALNLVIAVIALGRGGLSARHALSDSFVLSSGALGNALALTLSVAALVQIMSRKDKLAIFALVIFWFPHVLSGDRQYLSLVLLTLILMVWERNNEKASSVFAVAVVGSLALFGLLSTVLIWTSDVTILFNEWILPSHFMSMLMPGWQTQSSMGLTSLWDQWPFLLPKWMRPYEVHTLTDVTAQLHLVNVDVGGSPWAEAFIGGVVTSGSLFLLTSGTLAMVAWRLAERNAIAGLTSWLLLILWGRSFFWGTLLAMLMVWALSAFITPKRIAADIEE